MGAQAAQRLMKKLSKLGPIFYYSILGMVIQEHALWRLNSKPKLMYHKTDFELYHLKTIKRLTNNSPKLQFMTKMKQKREDIDWNF